MPANPVIIEVMPAVAWSVPVRALEAPKNLERLTSVLPLVERLESAVGTRPLAILLGVGPSTISKWKRRRHAVSAEYARRVIDLHDVLVRALQVMQPVVVMDWLVGHEPFLDDARPIDVLVSRGAAPLIEALRGIAATAYA